MLIVLGKSMMRSVANIGVDSAEHLSSAFSASMVRVHIIMRSVSLNVISVMRDVLR